jgi:2-oxo-4-hydroxy-4-carboxy-5-ureidoimidazoline decarboxylase
MESPPSLDLAAEDDARALLTRCCGSTRWVDRMLARRPFGTARLMVSAAREEWFALSEAQWRDAFAHHPKIGERPSLPRFAATRDLSAREQAGMDAAPAEVRARLAEGNRAYEAKFGYIFIIAAAGRPAAEMLAALEARLRNDAGAEIRIAAEEHAKIIERRLLGL